MKKWGSILGTSALAAAVLSACSGQPSAPEQPAAVEQGSNLNETGYPIVKEKIALRMVGRKSPTHGDWDQMLVTRTYEEKTNIGVRWELVAEQSYAEKVNLMFASNNLPDAFVGSSFTILEEEKFGKQGALIPLENLIEQYAPNLKRLMAKDPSIRRSITSSDGHIYALPRYTDLPRDMTAPFQINRKWLDQLGLAMPNTTDELYTVLKAFKERDPNGNGQPDEIPLSSVKLDSLKNVLLGAFGYIGNNHINMIDEKALFVPMQDNYSQFLMYMNKLHSEGLLDKEVFTQTQQQMKANGENNRIGAFLQGQARQVVGEALNDDYDAVPPLTSPFNAKKLWYRGTGITTGSGAITRSNPHPAETMRWFDYFYSPEGGFFAQYGVEGESWKWLDAAKTQWELSPPPGENSTQWRAMKITPFATGQFPAYRDLDMLSKEGQKWAMQQNEDVAAHYWEHAVVPMPTLRFNEEQVKTLSRLEADIKTYVDQMEAKFILGSEPFTEWNKFTDTLKKMGIDNVVQIYQDAYQAWKKN